MFAIKALTIYPIKAMWTEDYEHKVKRKLARVAGNTLPGLLVCYHLAVYAITKRILERPHLCEV